MKWFDDVEGPTDAELALIELEADVLAVEVALVDAESAFLARPSRSTAAVFVRALLDVVDLHDFTDHYSPTPCVLGEALEVLL